MPRYGNITSVILKDIYPIVSTAMDKNANNFKKCVERFIISRERDLYDNGPYSRLNFGINEYEDFWNSIKIQESQIEGIMKNCFFYGIPFNPPQIKEPFTVVALMIVRYFLKKGREKDAEIAAIYLAFSGKFYASVHGKTFPKFPPSEYREIMEFTINYKLSEKYSLRKEGSLFGAIRSLVITWMSTYKGIMISNNSDDKDYADVIQQLRDREFSFLSNIATPYMEAYQNKEYLNYESDNVGEDKYRITDNDAIACDRFTEKAINIITSNTVDYRFCKMICNADPNIKTDELKNIIEGIVSDNKNVSQIRRVINILISDFMANNKGKNIHSIDFLNYSMKAKPNTKNKDILELHDIITNWLCENSPLYNKRKSRIATANSYYKCVLFYFILIINKSSS